MSENVVKIRPAVERRAASEPVPEIVEALETMLEDARSGRIRSIGIATEVLMPEEHSTGCGNFWYRGEGGNAFTLLGGISYLRDVVSSQIIG